MPLNHPPTPLAGTKILVLSPQHEIPGKTPVSWSLCLNSLTAKERSTVSLWNIFLPAGLASEPE